METIYDCANSTLSRLFFSALEKSIILVDIYLPCCDVKIPGLKIQSWRLDFATLGFDVAKFLIPEAHFEAETRLSNLSKLHKLSTWSLVFGLEIGFGNREFCSIKTQKVHFQDCNRLEPFFENFLIGNDAQTRALSFNVLINSCQEQKKRIDRWCICNAPKSKGRLTQSTQKVNLRQAKSAKYWVGNRCFSLVCRSHFSEL